MLGLLRYDSESTGSAQVSYDIQLPEEGRPVWMQTEAPKVLDTGFTQFSIRAPFLVRQGSHQMRVKAVLSWEGGRVEVEREVPWQSDGWLLNIVNFGTQGYGKGVLIDGKEK